jgi:hypothetical protein
MPINYQQAAEQIRAMGEHAQGRAEHKRALLEEARRLLAEFAGQLDELRSAAEQARRFDPYLRCAVPVSQRLDTSHGSPPPSASYVLLAADGSQINPDRHDAVEFGAINVGAIRMYPGEAPRELVQSRLLLDDDLYDNKKPLSDNDVAIWRDLEERRMLFDLALQDRTNSQPVVTLTDGPLQLFGQGQDSRFFKARLDEYLSVLRDLAGLGASAAGYVDKPHSDYLVALLELMALKKTNELSQAGKLRPLWPVCDIELLEDLLEPGQRSAVLALSAPEPQPFTDELALHFFYLNVGRPGHAQLARVEIPRWVAEDDGLTDLLHAALLSQAAQMGARPFPYILHRAHEIAVVRLDEKDQIESMIQAELRRQGVGTGEKSSKQSAKDLQGRTRMKP